MQDIILEKKFDLTESQINLTLSGFLNDWDERYQNEAKKIELFIPEKVRSWSQEQKVFFIKVFYHIRGHFSDLLWYLGSFAPTKKTKEIILGNILDEFNPNGLSHEQLYFLFASAFKVDLTYELIDNTAYLPFAKKYIDGQLRWFRDNNWDSMLSGFAAIERLDNVDYVNFRDVAIHMGAEKKHLTFFNVHISADHFENILSGELESLWEKNKNLVINVFNFILEYQIDMLNKLSNAVLNHK